MTDRLMYAAPGMLCLFHVISILLVTVRSAYIFPFNLQLYAQVMNDYLVRLMHLMTQVCEVQVQPMTISDPAFGSVAHTCIMSYSQEWYCRLCIVRE